MAACTCDPKPWQYTDPEPMPDEDCPTHGNPAIIARQAADSVNESLVSLFIRLGPPSDRTNEK